jgi:thiamine-monophosphate kinase
MNLEGIGEDALIRELRATFEKDHPRLVMGPGDDTSVTTHNPGNVLLATTDILIEGTHFQRRYTRAYLLGKKALSVSLSDIAAMGGIPLFYLVSVGLRPRTPKKFLFDLYRGITTRARESKAVLAGGNTALSDKLMVSTTLFGEMPEKEVVYRAGARPGDAIYVTGTLGDSALGLKALLKHAARALEGPFRKAALKHLDPTARVAAGRALSSRRLASAMIDISDGLLLDLKRLTEASGTGAVLETARLPLSPQFKRYLKGLKRKGAGVKLALTGGEDYELLFTAPKEASKKIASLARSLRLPITPIGSITTAPEGITVIGEGARPVKLKGLGFSHF